MLSVDSHRLFSYGRPRPLLLTHPEPNPLPPLQRDPAGKGGLPEPPRVDLRAPPSLLPHLCVHFHYAMPFGDMRVDHFDRVPDLGSDDVILVLHIYPLLQSVREHLFWVHHQYLHLDNNQLSAHQDTNSEWACYHNSYWSADYHKHSDIPEEAKD